MAQILGRKLTTIGGARWSRFWDPGNHGPHPPVGLLPANTPVSRNVVPSVSTQDQQLRSGKHQSLPFNSPNELLTLEVTLIQTHHRRKIKLPTFAENYPRKEQHNPKDNYVLNLASDALSTTQWPQKEPQKREQK